MRTTSRQSGFGHVVTMAVVVLVFAIIGFIGYKLYANSLSNKDSNYGNSKRTDPRTTITESNVPVAPEIKTASDLDKAETVLNGVDPAASSSSDASQLDRQLNSF